MRSKLALGGACLGLGVLGLALMTLGPFMLVYAGNHLFGAGWNYDWSTWLAGFCLLTVLRTVVAPTSA